MKKPTDQSGYISSTACTRQHEQREDDTVRQLEAQLGGAVAGRYYLEIAMDHNGGREMSTALVEEVQSVLLACMARNLSPPLSCMIFQDLQSARWDPRWVQEPRAIRIGPCTRKKYHRVPRLETMQNHKWLCTARLIYSQIDHLESDGAPLVLIRRCLEKLKGLELRVKASYFDEFHLDSDELLLTMMLDGCFILFLLLIHANPREQFGSDYLNKELGEHRIRSMVKHDLLLLGNQVPFFVIRELCSVIMPGRSHDALIRGALKLFSTIWQCKSADTFSVDCDQVQHLLHLFYLSVIQDTQHSQESRGVEPLFQRMCCVPLRATELERAGIKVRARNNGCSFLDIEFNNRALVIPPLQIDGNTGVVLGSLIAFEQVYCYAPYHVTSYVCMMKNLMTGPDDQRLLARRGILRTHAVPAFSSLLYRDHLCHAPCMFYHAESSNIAEHYGRRWLRNFKNPSAGPLIVVAIILLLYSLRQFLSLFLEYNQGSTSAGHVEL